MDQFEKCLSSLQDFSPNTRVFCLIHKMDLVPEVQRQEIFDARRADIASKINRRFTFDCFRTSIWDETLYRAWSSIVSFLLPNIQVLKKNLKTFCEMINADEVVLFERSTFLVISDYDARNHED